MWGVGGLKSRAPHWAAPRQLVFANWDHTINVEGNRKGLRELWCDLNASCTGIPWEDLPDAFNSFGHEWGGYAARYYGYLYSEVFAADLFEKFRAEKSIIDRYAARGGEEGGF